MIVLNLWNEGPKVGGKQNTRSQRHKTRDPDPGITNDENPIEA